MAGLAGRGVKVEVVAAIITPDKRVRKTLEREREGGEREGVVARVLRK